MGRLTDRALRVLLVIIVLAIVAVALYIIFPPAQCGLGTSPAADCAIAPF